MNQASMLAPSDLPNGTSARVHADFSMQQVECTVTDVFARIRAPKRLSVAERDELHRRLAGVVGHCESIRVWLAAGAPTGSPTQVPGEEARS